MANILIVDDSRTSRKMLRNLLEENGHTIVGEARDGAEGVKLAAELKPDLITMDVTMPVMDGQAAMREIRKADKDVAIIMITAAGQKNKIIDCLKEGANEFITKPFEAEAVIKTIANLV